MSDLERRDDRSLRSRTGSVPTVAGRRVTDLSALAGGVIWLALVAGRIGGQAPLSAVASYVALATLVLVPLGLGLIDLPRAAPLADACYRFVTLVQFPAALAVGAALALPRGSPIAVGLVLPWLGVTGAMGLLGLRRLASRGWGPVPELAIDAALLYVPVASVFLALHAAAISLHFAPIIVLLTGVHFHYAGFVLPLVVGLTGRIVVAERGEFSTTRSSRVWTATTVVIVAGIAVIAVGITFSPLLEVIAVTVFTAGVAGFAALVLRAVVPAVPRLPGLLLGLAAASLFWTMALALAFAYSSLPGTSPVVSIPAMVRWHGSVNAFGFALPALLAFRLLEPG